MPLSLALPTIELVELTRKPWSGSKFLMDVTTKSLPWKYGWENHYPKVWSCCIDQKKLKKVSDTETQKTHQELKKRTPKKRLKQFVLFEAWTFHKPRALNAHKLSTPGDDFEHFWVSDAFWWPMNDKQHPRIPYHHENHQKTTVFCWPKLQKPNPIIGQSPELPHRWRWWRLWGFAISIEFTARQWIHHPGNGKT